MICIFPYFCPCEEIRKGNKGIIIKRCSLLYQEVLRNPVLPFLLSERRYLLEPFLSTNEAPQQRPRKEFSEVVEFQ